jgi:hypothetical protein
MRVVLIAAVLAVASGAAQAAVPAFTVTCGKKTEVKAAAGGPVMINGKEAKITSQTETYFEIKKGKTVYGITAGNPVAVTFTDKKGAKSTCKEGAPPPKPAKPPATPATE